VVYKTYVDTLGIDPSHVNTIENIPFLPIQFFKTSAVTTTQFKPEIIFESSGTTGENTSRHYVKLLQLYKESFTRGFNLFYDNPGKWCILALLPGYVERQNSSLVTMVQELIIKSDNAYSGFYLNNHEKLYRALEYNEATKQQTLLIGVTFALLDFAENHPMKLRYTTIMETGGMKGRREEITREEVYNILEHNLGAPPINSEYGMTELLSQAYSKEKGLYKCAPWMKVLIREENDPFAITGSSGARKPLSGLLNIIDLANLYSCSFIATDDVGKLYKEGSFEVLGRRDISDIRGCSLLTVTDDK
jgi:Acyl-protein synthetase, LuxE